MAENINAFRARESIDRTVTYLPGTIQSSINHLPNYYGVSLNETQLQTGATRRVGGVTERFDGYSWLRVG